ncbi:hypothetical protein MZI65_12790 [Escherichia coli]|nr:hypothetical protein [Escherichia coli]
MKTLLIALLLSIISFYSYSAENAAVINQTISGTIKNKITQRGFSANDPRYYGTLKGISGYLNSTASGSKAYTVAGVSGRSWLSVGLRGALLSRGTLIALAASGAVAWLIETEDSVQIKVKEITGEQGVKGFYWNIGAESYVTATEGAQSICQHNPTFCQTYIVEQYNADSTRSDLRTIKFYIDSSKTQLWASRTANLVSCGTNKVMPTCQPDYVPGSNEVIKTVSVQDAINSISDTEMQTDLSPEVISDVVNNAWQKAASEAGYSGFAYDHTRPVTARDVTASTGAAKPAVSDFLKPSDKPDFTLPADTTGTTPTNPSTGEQVNLGDDPGIGPPELENIPAGTEILSPLLSFNPFEDSAGALNAESERIKYAECPKPVLEVFNGQYKLETHCTLLNNNAAMIGVIFLFIYSIAAFRIILSA